MTEQPQDIKQTQDIKQSVREDGDPEEVATDDLRRFAVGAAEEAADSDAPLEPPVPERTAFQMLSRLQRAKVLAVYYPTLAYNVLLGKVLRLRPWWSRVDDALVLGALPFASDAERLFTEENVRGVINTCMEYPGPVRAYDRLGIEQLWVPTVDFTHPAIESVHQGVDFIEKFAERGESVYVHCKAGRARSATIAACWLIQSQGLTPDGAQAALSAKRSHVNPNLAQRPVVQQFANELAARGQDDGESTESGDANPVEPQIDS